MEPDSAAAVLSASLTSEAADWLDASTRHAGAQPMAAAIQSGALDKEAMR